MEAHPSHLVRKGVVVSGHVQGVGFRLSLARQASAGGVTGWVRNLPDGRVEAALEGDTAAVDRVLSWCRVGPRGAEVTSIAVADEPPSGARGFTVR